MGERLFPLVRGSLLEFVFVFSIMLRAALLIAASFGVILASESGESTGLNSPPKFDGDTPLPVDGVQPTRDLCVGKTVFFEVTVSDPDPDDVVVIEFLNDGGYAIPNGADIGEDDYSLSSNDKLNKVRKTFSWAPDADNESQGKIPVCFKGVELKQEFPMETTIQCVTIAVSYPPKFVSPRTPPRLGESDECANLKAFVNQPLEFTMEAMDSNEDEDVSIFENELPLGTQFSEAVCPGADAEGIPQPCNPVRRVFSWTPRDGDEGSSYKVTFRARDSNNACQPGGYYSADYCVRIEVEKPRPEWVVPPTAEGGEETCDDATVYKNYVNCLVSFCLKARDANNHYGVMITESLGENAMPEGMSWADSAPSADSESGLPVTMERCTQWVPARGQEGHRYDLLFHASDSSGLEEYQVHKCIKINIVRCKYCVEDGDSMLSIAAEYDLDWLQLWGVNVDVKNPDHLFNGQIVNLCPVYYVKDQDTLDGIAARFGTHPDHIALMNPDLEEVDVKSIPVGQELCVCPGICNEVEYHFQHD